MEEGIIRKAISGFYYVDTGGELISCRARGTMRRDKITPLVGDRVRIAITGLGTGVLEEVIPRANAFIRPPVANLDQMIVFASAVIPVTDPYLIDRVTAVAELHGVTPVICINKCDLDSGEALFDIYSRTCYKTIRTSAVTGEGIEELRRVIAGKVSAFTGNSGVGKSSILNALVPGFQIKTNEVSDKLGRGRHTTRHVELYRLPDDAIVADTPGFSSFDTQRMDLIAKEDLQYSFPEFSPFFGQCRFRDCRHTGESGCAVMNAVEKGIIHPSRHSSYVRLYQLASQTKEWEHRIVPLSPICHNPPTFCISCIIQVTRKGGYFYVAERLANRCRCHHRNRAADYFCADTAARCVVVYPWRSAGGSWCLVDSPIILGV